MDDRKRLLDLIDRMGSATVVLYGDLVLDRFVLGTPKRISREAPVIILRHDGQRDIAGGGANALTNLHALGVRALPVGVVGDDEPGAALLKTLAASGLDTSRIVRVAGYNTPTKVRILGGGSSSLKHQVARYDIEDQLPANGQWRIDLQAHLELALNENDAVAVSDYGYGTVTTESLAALRRPDHRPRWTCLDSRYRLGELSPVDGATPNLQELEAWAGCSLDDDQSVASAAEELRQQLDARFLLATRGHRGVTLVEPDRPTLHLSVYGTDEVADVTGAGDTVLAVLTAALAAGADPSDGATLSNIAGGIVVMKLGTATVTRDELRHAVAGGPLPRPV